MAALVLRVLERHLVLGCSDGLPQATAKVVVGVGGAVDATALERIRAGTGSLRSARRESDSAETVWPTAFLMGNGVDDAVPHRMLGEWIVALTVALQRWVGDPVWRGRVLAAGPDRLDLALPWQRDGVLDDMVRLALQTVELWAGSAPEHWPDVNAAIDPGMQAASAGGLRPDALRLALGAIGRGIPVDLRPGHVQYGWGHRLQRLHSTLTGRTGYVAAMIAENKWQSARLLGAAGLPVPEGAVVADYDRALRAADALGWPVVVKPLNQEQGRGVVAGIRGEDGLRRAFDAADRFSPGEVVVEKHVDGDDHRLQVVNGRCVTALHKTPGGITGDGVSTVGQLLERLNADPRRGTGAPFFMKPIPLDDEARECLSEQKLRVDSVPVAGRWIALRRIANVHVGGSAEDVTESVHPDNRRLAERAARIVGLDIAGLDFLTPDITRSWREVGGAICEVNAFPEMGDPDWGIHRKVLDVLFEDGTARIPTVAIGGPGGAGAAALLLHRIWMSAGTLSGLCATTTVRVGEDIVADGDCGGLPRAGMVLNDPAVQAAVFEFSADDLGVMGSPCDRYDVAALMDVGPESVGRYADVLQRARGAIVIGADDRVGRDLLGHPPDTGRQVMVGAAPSAALTAHRDGGGEVVYLGRRDGATWVIGAAGARETPLAPLPDTAGAVLPVIFAAAIAWIQGVDPASIAAGVGAVAAESGLVG